MTRIVAGTWGGRRLIAPKGQTTRPTTERVREAVFSSLQSHFGSFGGLRVLDLFAGTGALALESLSRGAASADLVEKDAKAAAVLTANIKALSAERQAKVHKIAASAFLRSRAGAGIQWDIVFLDPPYDFGHEELRQLLRETEPLVDPDGLFVVERSARSGFTWETPIEALREKKYGETQIWYGR